MRHDFLDRYSRASSPLHTLPPLAKLVSALILFLAINFVPVRFGPLAGWPLGYVHVGIAALLVIGFAIARIPAAYVGLRLIVFAPLLAFLALSIPLARGLTSGWDTMAAVLIRGMLSFATVLLVVNTTPFDRLLSSMGRIGVPRLLVATLTFMYRYLFVLLDQLVRMRRARRARCFVDSRVADLRAAPSLIGMLLLRSFERSERVHAAMLARGFDGTLRTIDDCPDGTDPPSN